MPEAQIVLSQAQYVASAPKSNSAVTAIGTAMKVVETERTATIPPYLRDAHYEVQKSWGMESVINMLTIIKIIM